MGIIKGKHIYCCTSDECEGCYYEPSAVSAGSPLMDDMTDSVRALVNIVESVIEEGKARIYHRDRENLSRALAALKRYDAGER